MCADCHKVPRETFGTCLCYFPFPSLVASCSGVADFESALCAGPRARGAPGLKRRKGRKANKA